MIALRTEAFNITNNYIIGLQSLAGIYFRILVE